MMSDFFDGFEKDNQLLCQLERIKLEKDEMLCADHCPSIWVHSGSTDLSIVKTINGSIITWKDAAKYLIKAQLFF